MPRPQHLVLAMSACRSSISGIYQTSGSTPAKVPGDVGSLFGWSCGGIGTTAIRNTFLGLPRGL